MCHFYKGEIIFRNRNIINSQFCFSSLSLSLLYSSVLFSMPPSESPSQLGPCLESENIHSPRLNYHSCREPLLSAQGGGKSSVSVMFASRSVHAGQSYGFWWKSCAVWSCMPQTMQSLDTWSMVSFFLDSEECVEAERQAQWWWELRGCWRPQPRLSELFYPRWYSMSFAK